MPRYHATVPRLELGAILKIQRMLEEVEDFDIEIERLPNGKARLHTTIEAKEKVQQLKEERGRR